MPHQALWAEYHDRHKQKTICNKSPHTRNPAALPELATNKTAAIAGPLMLPIPPATTPAVSCVDRAPVNIDGWMNPT